MKNLKVFNVNYETAFDVVKENIYSCVVEPIKIEDTKFHHQINIKRVPDAIEYGLLSKKKYVEKVENRKLTEKEIFIFNDDCHVNGLDHISISTMDLDLHQMSKKEELWGTYNTTDPDIIVSKDVKSRKVTVNYFNEFLVEDEIPTDMFNCIDVRILRIIDHTSLSLKCATREDRINYLLEYYEGIRKIALALKEKNLNIPLREVSEINKLGEDDKALTLDINKVIEMPRLILK